MPPEPAAMVAPSPIDVSTCGVRIACASERPPLPRPSTTPVAVASANAFSTELRLIEPLTVTSCEPSAACTIGLPEPPGCTKEFDCAPAPATIPPDRAVACDVVFAVPYELTVRPPPLVTPPSNVARVEPSKIASDSLLPAANSPPPERPSVVAFGAENEADRREMTPAPPESVTVLGTETSTTVESCALAVAPPTPTRPPAAAASASAFAACTAFV